MTLTADVGGKNVDKTTSIRQGGPGMPQYLVQESSKAYPSDTNKLELLQYRALRFVFDDYESAYNILLARANQGCQ